MFSREYVFLKNVNLKKKNAADLQKSMSAAFLAVRVVFYKASIMSVMSKRLGASSINKLLNHFLWKPYFNSSFLLVNPKT